MVRGEPVVKGESALWRKTSFLSSAVLRRKTPNTKCALLMLSHYPAAGGPRLHKEQKALAHLL